MLLQLQLPSHDEAIALNRVRWAEVLSDAQWNDFPGKIETNAFGQIVVTPPADLSHGRRQFRISQLLEAQLGGRAVTECPIATADGVKAADAVWFSIDRYQAMKDQRAAEVAPEICVEVISPRNTEVEMQLKRQLYFAAGTIECWTCDLEGHMTYYNSADPDTPLTQSKLCPRFPNTITD